MGRDISLSLLSDLLWMYWYVEEEGGSLTFRAYYLKLPSNQPGTFPHANQPIMSHLSTDRVWIKTNTVISHLDGQLVLLRGCLYPDGTGLCMVSYIGESFRDDSSHMFAGGSWC